MIEVRHLVPAAFGDPLLEIRIAPKLTGYPPALKWLLGAYAALCLGVAGAFALHGAVPVFGFAGLEIALLFVALRYAFRRAAVTERLSLAGDATVVRRESARGTAETTRLQSYWLRIDEGRNGITLSSRGTSVSLGGFLMSHERRQIAAALRDALDRTRVAPQSA